jgi:hypothetical protein
MLRFELLDGTQRYIPQDRVMIIHPHAEEGLVVRFRNPKDEVQNMRCKRFQIVKSATWYD